MSDDKSKSKSSAQDKANEIITKLTDKNPSDKAAIDAQKKANKKYLGYEGECDHDKH